MLEGEKEEGSDSRLFHIHVYVKNTKVSGVIKQICITQIFITQ